MRLDRRGLITGSTAALAFSGLARQAASDWSVSLVAPHPYYIEAGMLSGYVAGHYALDEIRAIKAAIDAKE